MRPRYYYNGGPFDGATIHRSKHCSELEDPKPLSESTVEVVMSNGDVCGRERPCGYHDD